MALTCVTKPASSRPLHTVTVARLVFSLSSRDHSGVRLFWTWEFHQAIGLRKRPHRSGAIFWVWWSGDVSGARPQHLRVRVVSRFSAVQKTCKNIEMAANASVFQLCVGVVRPCGSCPVPARFLPSGRFLPGSCPAPARSLPDGRAGAASVGRFLRRSRAATAAPLSGAAPPLCGCFLT